MRVVQVCPKLLQYYRWDEVILYQHELAGLEYMRYPARRVGGK